MTTPMPELPVSAWAKRINIDTEFEQYCFSPDQTSDYKEPFCKLSDALAAIEASQPAGYQLVPIEPTDQMLYALIKEWDSVGGLTMYENYRAMLSAAPATPQGKI